MKAKIDKIARIEVTEHGFVHLDTQRDCPHSGAARGAELNPQIFWRVSGIVDKGAGEHRLIGLHIE